MCVSTISFRADRKTNKWTTNHGKNDKEKAKKSETKALQLKIRIPKKMKNGINEIAPEP